MTIEINILIVEDEPIIAEDLAFMLEEMGYLHHHIVHSAEQAISLIGEKSFDLILLDINLDGHKDGVDVGSYLYHNTEIPFIFLTSLSDQVTLSRVKKIFPSSYLVKPIDEKDLRVNIELALVGNDNKKVKTDDLYPRYYYIKGKHKISKIDTYQILYLEGSNNYTIIHLIDKKHVISQTLKKVQESMNPSKFIRVHKSSLVNIEKIEEISNSHIKIHNIKIPIGRTYRENFLSKLKMI